MRECPASGNNNLGVETQCVPAGREQMRERTSGCREEYEEKVLGIWQVEMSRLGLALVQWAKPLHTTPAPHVRAPV